MIQLILVLVAESSIVCKISFRNPWHLDRVDSKLHKHGGKRAWDWPERKCLEARMGIMVQGSHFKFLDMPLTESCRSMGKLGVMASQQGFPSISLTLTRMCVCGLFIF